MSQSRSIYVIEPTLVYPDDSVKTVGADFWEKLHEHVEHMPLSARTVGWAPSEVRGAAKRVSDLPYFYVSKK